MTYFPGGSAFLALILGPLTAGTLCGLTGSGSAIVIQVCFRLFMALGISIGQDDAEASRRILAIASILSITQYPVAVYGLWKRPESNIRWDAVAYLFPGMNTLVWLGTFAAMTWDPVILLYILGAILIAIACFQFVHQSILGRKIDDEKVKADYRKKLNWRYQQGLSSDGLVIQANSSSHQSASPSSTASTVPQHKSIAGTDLADLELGDAAPKQPKSLKAPNQSFDLQAYSNQTGLNLAFPTEQQRDSQPGTDQGSFPPHTSMYQNHGQQASYGHLASADTAIRVQTVYGDSNDDGDDDEFAEISIEDSHRLRDTRPIWVKVWEDARNNPRGLLIGLAAGCLAGILGGLCGMNGPPVLIFLFSLKLSGAQMRDTSIIIYFSHIPCLLLARIIFSVFRLNEWFIYCVAVAASTSGLFIGSHLHHYCDTRLIMTCLQFVILLSSVTLTKPSTHDVLSGIFFGIYLFLALCILAFAGWRIARNRIIKEQAKQQFYTLNTS